MLSSLKMKLIHERLREELKMSGLSQIEAARAAGLADVQGIRDVLAGRKRLSVELLAALVPVGVDVFYVVTGTRQPQAQDMALNDRARLVAAVEAVEEGLAELRRKLPPKKRAELILAAYDLMTEPEQSRTNVVNLVRIAA